jgi:hypothetical protein
VALLASPPALALSPEAREFMEITKQLEPVQCEKRKLRREIALAMAESRDAAPLRKRFAELNRDPRTAQLEKRLARLGSIVEKSPDPEDLQSIHAQQRDALYRCD